MNAHDARLLEMLSAYLDGEATPGEKEEVEALLASSENARKMLDDLRGISSGLREIPAPPVPEKLRSRIAHSLERMPARSEPFASARRLPTKIIASLAALAATILVAFFVLDFGEPKVADPDPSPVKQARASADARKEPAGALLDQMGRFAEKGRPEPPSPTETPPRRSARQAKRSDDLSALAEAESPTTTSRLRRQEMDPQANGLRETKTAAAAAAPEEPASTGDEQPDRLARCPADAPFLHDRPVPLDLAAGQMPAHALLESTAGLDVRWRPRKGRPGQWEVLFAAEDRLAVERALHIDSTEGFAADTRRESAPCYRIAVSPEESQNDSER